MTREEALKIFNTLLLFHEAICTPEELEELCTIAIKALGQKPCEDCISRQAVIDLIGHYNSDGLGSVFYGYDEGVKFANAVNKLPSVKPQEPKTGHWIKQFVGNGWNDYWEYTCSECKTKYQRVDVKMNYCPNCGCRMSEVSE